jgi:hypothetical protein
VELITPKPPARAIYERRDVTHDIDRWLIERARRS